MTDNRGRKQRPDITFQVGGTPESSGSRNKIVLLAIIAIVLIIASFSVMFAQPQEKTNTTKETKSNVTCSDSDIGDRPEVRGTCKDGKEFIDECKTDIILIEYSCKENRCVSSDVNCDTFDLICNNGKCERYLNASNKSTSTNGDNSSRIDLTIDSMNHYVTNKTVTEIVINETSNETISNITYVKINLYVSAVVRNLGNSPSDISKVNFSISGRTTAEEIARTPVIFGGDFTIVSALFRINESPGTYNVRASVDWFKKVEETNENNNDYTFSVKVT